MLKPQAEPGCAVKTSRRDGGKGQERGVERAPTRVASLAGHAPRSDGEPPAPGAVSQLSQADPNAGLTTRIRLEYERNCFQRAEMRVRDRLQAAVGKTIRAIKRAAQDGP